MSCHVVYHSIKSNQIIFLLPLLVPAFFSIAEYGQYPLLTVPNNVILKHFTTEDLYYALFKLY